MIAVSSFAGSKSSFGFNIVLLLHRLIIHQWRLYCSPSTFRRAKARSMQSHAMASMRTVAAAAGFSNSSTLVGRKIVGIARTDRRTQTSYPKSGWSIRSRPRNPRLRGDRRRGPMHTALSIIRCSWVPARAPTQVGYSRLAQIDCRSRVNPRSVGAWPERQRSDQPEMVLPEHFLFRTDSNSLNQTNPLFFVIACHVLQHRWPVLTEDNMQSERQRRARNLAPRLRPHQRIGRQVLKTLHAKARRLDRMARGLRRQ